MQAATFSMLTVDRRRLLEWTYFAELSYLLLERQEMLSLLLPTLYIFASQDGGSFRILPLILNLRNDVIVNARSLLYEEYTCTYSMCAQHNNLVHTQWLSP